MGKMGRVHYKGTISPVNSQRVDPFILPWGSGGFVQ